MAELFRYIQQAFVTPSERRPIDVGRRSDLQDRLRDAASQRVPRERLRSIADGFIAQHFRSRRDDPLQLGAQLRSASERLDKPLDGPDAIDQVIAATFGKNARDLVASDAFAADKALLDDILVSVKISTGFDRVNAHQLVAMRQVMALIEDVAARDVADDTVEGIRAAVRRPIRIPDEFVYPVAVSSAGPPSAPPERSDEASRRHAELLAQQQHLKRAYEMIMSLPPDRFELKRMGGEAAGHGAQRTNGNEAAGGGRCVVDMEAASPGPPMFLGLPDAVIERLGADVRKTLEQSNIDIAGSPVPHIVSQITRRWQALSQELAPYQAPAPAKVYRLGAHLLAVQDDAASIAARTGEPK